MYFVTVTSRTRRPPVSWRTPFAFCTVTYHWSRLMTIRSYGYRSAGDPFGPSRQPVSAVGLREAVAFAADGLDEFWILRIVEFLTKPGDVHNDNTRRDFAIILPHLLQNFFTWNDAVAMIHEITQ